MNLLKIKGLIFDLDGVLVDTAHLHYLSWKKMASHFNFEFDESLNEHLKGASREASLELVMQWGKLKFNDEDKKFWLHQKNEWYLELIEELNEKDLLPGVKLFLTKAKALGLKMAVGSASKNAMTIIKKVNLLPYFDTVIDGKMTTHSKPHPEVFSLAAELMDLAPNVCIVFEDSQKGVEAAIASGAHCIGLSQSIELKGTDANLTSLNGISPELIIQKLVKY